jgi:hypothetical protein
MELIRLGTKALEDEETKHEYYFVSSRGIKRCRRTEDEEEDEILW